MDALRLLRFTFLLLALAATPSIADWPSDFAGIANEVEVATCTGKLSTRSCHLTYPTGCTRSRNPRYDAYLNFLKNQTPAPDTPAAREVTWESFRELDENTPGALTKGNHSEHAEVLASLGEGAIAEVIGYLYYVQRTGAESTNCQLTGLAHVDYHLGIGFDDRTASRLHGGRRVPRSLRKRLLQTSIVVEATPHYRLWHQPTWTMSLFKRHVGRQVRVVGQLMADNEHFNAKDNCANLTANRKTCWRASAWEIHPVIEFYVCVAVSRCEKDSPQWMRLADAQ